jgi:hypothetical protein
MPTAPPYAQEIVPHDAEIDQLSETRVVWYVGDTIRPNEKHFNPEWKGFGGVFLPQFKTLSHDGNKGMVYRCRFTSMRVKMRQEWNQMLAPGELQYWKKSYTIKNAYDPKTQTFADQVVKSPDQVYRPDIFPGREILAITQATPGYDLGGRVEITALRNADDREIQAAQLFFFPNWGEIIAAKAALPIKIREIENHIQERIDTIGTLPPDLQMKYRSIANDMLKGCSQYRMGGMAYLKELEDAGNEAKAKGSRYNYPELGLMILEQLEQKRKDDLIAGENSAVGDLVREMRADRVDKSNLEERKLYLAEVTAGIRERDEVEEVRLGIRKVEQPVSGERTYIMGDNPTTEQVNNRFHDLGHVTPGRESEIVDEPDDIGAMAATQPRICGQPTAKGECQRVLRGEETACFYHIKLL